jgi:hypothetical protein
MVAVARPHTKLGQRDFCKIYPNFYGAVYPPVYLSLNALICFVVLYQMLVCNWEEFAVQARICGIMTFELEFGQASESADVAANMAG